MVNNLSGIYEIQNTITGERYIGSSVNIPVRWRGHKSALASRIHGNGHLQRAWNKYGESSFSFAVLRIIDNVEDLLINEQEFIDNLYPEYNICHTAGNTLGVKKSEEVRRKISMSKKGTVTWNKGTKGLQFASDETRLKMSGAHKGKTWKSSVPAWNKGVESLFIGATHPKSKRVIQYSLSMDFIAEHASTGEAGRQTGIYQSQICRCCNRKIKSASGFIWRYAEVSNV